MFIMSYHDLYWRPADGSWPPTDPNVLLAKLYAALKPGAVVVVEDHVAPANTDTSGTVDKLHRIDPAIVKRDFAKAGFVFDTESRVLAHPTTITRSRCSTTRSAARPTSCLPVQETAP
jgi:predicted methyltransferase